MLIVIYQQGESLVLMTPAPQEQSGLSLEQVIEKDVPINTPHIVIDSSELPPPPQEAWQLVDEDGVLKVKVNEEKLTQLNEERFQTEKEDRQNQVRKAISVYQTKLQLGRKLTDTELASLNAWLDYSDAVDAVDPENPVWPEPPSN